jgi:hypothetical protein
MKTRKQILNDRIRRIAQHRDAPYAPVDAATLLHAETQRCYALGGRLANKMAWSFRLAAAKLESWCDPALLVRYQKITPMPDLVQKWRAKAELFTGQAGAREDRGDANGANACRCVASTFEECAKQLSDLSQQNACGEPQGKNQDHEK